MISVRLPASLLGAFRAATNPQRITIHEAARRVIEAMSTITQDEIEQLREPPREIQNPRVSLYLGWRSIDALTALTTNSTLTNSIIFRRLLYGLLVTKEIKFVQQNGYWNLKVVLDPAIKNPTFSNCKKGSRALS